MPTFDAVFVEPDPFDAQISQPAPFTADIKRLINPFDTTATAPDVVAGKTFYDKDGIKTTGTYDWDFKGFRPVLIKPNFYSSTVKLKDTLFHGWTPSTTAKTIVATVNAGTFTADTENYEYLIHWAFEFDAAYVTGATLKSTPQRECADIWQSIFRRPSNYANVTASNYNANVCVTMTTTPLMVYYNSSGALTMNYSISSGIYTSATAATFSSGSSYTPTVTVRTPAVNAKCNATYFATARAAEIDEDNSAYTVKGEVWQVSTGAVMRSLYGLVIDLYNNPLT